MAELTIIGGKPLRGTAELAGDEQVVLALQAASLLATRGTVILDGVPRRTAIVATNDFLQSMGAKLIDDRQKASLRLDAGHHLEGLPLNGENLFLAGGVLARCREVVLTNPGNDPIISREITAITAVFSQLGAKIDVAPGRTTIAASYLSDCTLNLAGCGFNVCVATMVVAVLAQGITVVQGLGRQPYVGALVRLLNQMGARIHESADGSLRIQGVTALHGADQEVASDQLTAALYLVAAAITAGDVVVQGADATYLKPLADHLEAMGHTVITQHNGIRLIGTQIMLPTDEPTDLANLKDDRLAGALLALHARQFGANRVRVNPSDLGPLTELFLGPLEKVEDLLPLSGGMTKIPATLELAQAGELAVITSLFLALGTKQNTKLLPAEALEHPAGHLLTGLTKLGANLEMEF